jgi:hypothetical protein
MKKTVILAAMLLTLSFGAFAEHDTLEDSTDNWLQSTSNGLDLGDGSDIVDGNQLGAPAPVGDFTAPMLLSFALAYILWVKRRATYGSRD